MQFVQALQAVASMWLQHAHLRFERVNAGPADISISLSRDGNFWSHIGTQSTKHTPSMNLGFRDHNIKPEEFRRKVLHEFGHALGLVHEHQTPNARIEWNKPVVIAELKQQGWTQDRVERNMFRRHTAQEVRASEFDTLSIMLYYIPAHWTLNAFQVAYNTSLSRYNKHYIGVVYPPR